MKLKPIFRAATQWFSDTPIRALDQAYRAALKIKDIENKYFNGQKVSSQSSDYGESVISYFKTEVKGYIQAINLRLAVFKASRLFMNMSESGNSQLTQNNQYVDLDDSQSSLILEKLKLIDEVLERYRFNDLKDERVNRSSLDYSKQLVEKNQVPRLNPSKQKNSKAGYLDSQDLNNQGVEGAFEKRGVLPRSFLRTLNRLKQEIDPKSEETEEAVLKRFRSSRYKTAISIKFILLLIIVPLLTHQLTKNFLISPIVETYFIHQDQIVFINKDLEEEAFAELQHFEEALHFRSMIGLMPRLSSEEMEAKVTEKAKEISEGFRHQGVDAIANVFADIFSLGAFAIVIVMSRREIEIVKSFLDEILYSLSDSAKAFLIILFTDMFVGFHSPHGWEVILEGISRHFGLPENRDFNFLFIATFPVILDTVLKYWIFRYLNRISPSAVATYRNMNE